MVTKMPRIVIIGAGMAGIAAANKLFTSAGSELFEVCVVEGDTRIGGRISTSEFGGDRIEMGATWIHGIGGSPIHKIAQEINSLESEQPWECMDGYLDHPLTIAEGGYVLNPSLVEHITNLFNKLMDFAQGKLNQDGLSSQKIDSSVISAKSIANAGSQGLSIGSFLREGLEAYRGSIKDQEDVTVFDSWSTKSLEEALFAMLENNQRTFTSACDLLTLDYAAESEYRMFPGEEITIAKGYLSIVESLASVLPAGTIQLGRKVCKIEWQPDEQKPLCMETSSVHGTRPVKLHFDDGATMFADHVIVTVSLGVLKHGIRDESGMFDPPLPSFKTRAISRLGFGVVNKLFLQLSSTDDDQEGEGRGRTNFPSLQMVFHQSDAKLNQIPWWMRRTASLSPIHSKSSVLLSWFAGKEALELESLSDEEIINGVSSTISNFLPCHIKSNNSHGLCNGTVNSAEKLSNGTTQVKFAKVLKTQWGTNPLFLGSYSYVAVGSSGDDLDTLAEPLPRNGKPGSNASSPPLQILFAGEATHRTHYSTTHGAYFSGLREANRLLQHYNSVGV